MNARTDQAAEQNRLRDQMAQRVAQACQDGHVGLIRKVDGNVFTVENLAGTQYTVTVSRARNQVA